MFWRLGVKLARRGLNRNALAVVSLAVATLALAFGGFGVGAGQPGVAAQSVRRYLGGDVIVHVPALGLSGLAPPAGTTWHWQQPALDQPDPLARFDPSLLWYGAPAGTPVDPRHVAAVLARVPGIAQVLPYDALPALWAYAPGQYARVEVVARDAADDRATGFTTANVTAGRYFGSQAAVALVDGFRPPLAAGRNHPAHPLVTLDDGTPVELPAPVPAVGARLQLALPRWRDGAPDWSRLVQVHPQVVGQYRVPDGAWNWQSDHLTPSGVRAIPRPPAGPPPIRPDQMVEPADFATGAVLVPAAYWQALARETGWRPPTGEGTWILRLQGGLRAVNSVVETLQRRLPSATVAGVTTLAAATRTVRDPAVAVPKADVQAVRGRAPALPAPPPSAPAWVQSVVVAVMEVIAFLIFAGDLYVVLINRRQEIAALRAAGASVGQVAAMLGAELVLVTGSGVVLGLAITLPLFTWQILSNGAGLLPLARAFGRLIAAVLGGVIPLVGTVWVLAVLWAARLPPMGVLRGG